MKIHTDQVETLAKSVTAFAAKTFVSVAKRDDVTGALPKSPYLVIHPSDGSDQSPRLSGPAVSQRPSFIFHVVGGSYGQVSSGVSLLKEKFIPGGVGHTFVIPGWLCGRVWWKSPLPVQVDNDITPALVYQVIELGFSADPVA